MDNSEIIDFMRQISQEIDITLNSVCTSLLLNEPVLDVKLGDQAQSTEGIPIKFYGENDKKLESIVNKANDDIEEGNQAINTKRAAINDLLTLLQEEQEELVHLEKTLEKLQKSFDKQEAKYNAEILPRTKAIRVYKLLTGTHFEFRKAVLSGYIKLDEAWDVFEYDRSRFGNKEIQEKLFNLLNSLSRVQ